jgi:hypothetical protein
MWVACTALAKRLAVNRIVRRNPPTPFLPSNPFDRTLSHNSGNGSQAGWRTSRDGTVSGQISQECSLSDYRDFAYQIDLVVTVCSHRLFCSVAINVKSFPKGNLGRALLGKFLRMRPQKIRLRTISGQASGRWELIQNIGKL